MKHRIAFWLLAVIITVSCCGCSIKGGSSSSGSSSSAEAGEMTHKADHSIFFMLEGEPATFVLMRSVPVEGKLVFAGLPSDLTDGHNTLLEMYTNEKRSLTQSYTQNIIKADIDWYMSLPRDSFVQLCDMAAGGNGGFSGQELLSRITDTSAGSEKQRADNAAELISGMVESAGGSYLADNIDGAFPILIRSTDNNISQKNYDARSYAIKELLRDLDHASVYSFDGEYTDDGFVISKDSLADFREKYYQ